MKQRRACRLNYEWLVSRFESVLPLSLSLSLSFSSSFSFFLSSVLPLNGIQPRMEDSGSRRSRIRALVSFFSILYTCYSTFWLYFSSPLLLPGLYFKTRLVPNDATYLGRTIDSGFIARTPSQGTPSLSPLRRRVPLYTELNRNYNKRNTWQFHYLLPSL